MTRCNFKYGLGTDTLQDLHKCVTGAGATRSRLGKTSSLRGSMDSETSRNAWTEPFRYPEGPSTEIIRNLDFYTGTYWYGMGQILLGEVLGPSQNYSGVSNSQVPIPQRVGRLFKGHPPKGQPMHGNSHMVLVRINCKPA